MEKRKAALHEIGLGWCWCISMQFSNISEEFKFRIINSVNPNFRKTVS